MNTMYHEQNLRPVSGSVLVVGGGLVGLSAALFLAWQGVPVVLVERHPGSSPHPRAIGYTARTLELLRAVGLGPRIPMTPPDFSLRRARVESLAGTWFEESDWTPPAKEAPRIEYSPGFFDICATSSFGTYVPKSPVMSCRERASMKKP